MGNTPKVRIVSIKLPADLDQALTSAAYRMRISRSAVVREAVRAFTGEQSRTSVIALAGDLVGCIQGPGDLSTNKKYLKNYGK